MSSGPARSALAQRRRLAGENDRNASGGGRVRWAHAGTFTLGLLVACGGKLDNPEDFPRVNPALDTSADASGGNAGNGGSPCDATVIFQISCGSGICHERTADSAPPALDLLSPGVEARLVGVPASYVGVANDEVLACPVPPELLIDPSDADGSLLIRKVEGTHSCGTRMPNDVFPLAQPEQQCIRDWVVALVAASSTP
jgi:hypothetical protein